MAYLPSVMPSAWVSRLASHSHAHTPNAHAHTATPTHPALITRVRVQGISKSSTPLLLSTNNHCKLNVTSFTVLWAELSLIVLALTVSPLLGFEVASCWNGHHKLIHFLTVRILGHLNGWKLPKKLVQQFIAQNLTIHGQKRTHLCERREVRGDPYKFLCTVCGQQVACNQGKRDVERYIGKAMHPRNLKGQSTISFQA